MSKDREVDEPKPRRRRDDDGDEDSPKDLAKWIALFGLGTLIGVAGSVGFRSAMEKFRRRRSVIQGQAKDLPLKEVAGLLLSFSAFFPFGKWKYALTGIGAGMTAEEIVARLWKRANLAPMTAAEVGTFPVVDRFRDAELIARFSNLVHYSPNLPMRQKEDIILPLFADIIRDQRANPLQDEAVAAYKWETGTPTDTFSLEDSLMVQNWVQYWGTYTASEGLWWGHDRWRLLSKLLRDRKYGSLMKDGHASFEYDCDCITLSHNLIVDSYRKYDTYFVLISQKPPYQGLHPLHHVLPAVLVDGVFYLTEMIKSYPFVPISQGHLLFQNLKRTVLVHPDGSWEEVPVAK